MGFMAEIPIKLKLKLSMSRQTTSEEPLGKKLLHRRGSDYLTKGTGENRRQRPDLVDFAPSTLQ
jgi:hypothetical protein